ILVSEVPQLADTVSSSQVDAVDNLTVSSHYASAAEDGSDTSSEPRCMSLGPSDASMMEERSRIRRPSPTRSGSQPKGSTPADQATITLSSDRSAERCKSFFNTAMDRFLAEQQAAGAGPIVAELQNTGSRDFEMGSIRPLDRGSNWEYYPDNIDFSTPAQAAVDTAASGSTMIQRIRIPATEGDPDEGLARAWISKVKSAFMQDQASDAEKCLTFAAFIAGSAKNWYRQLSRSTRNKWSDLLRNFQI
ncbi:hypothetical protein PHMEG_0007618, partial [Phytophthora megakarya]